MYHRAVLTLTQLKYIRQSNGLLRQPKVSYPFYRSNRFRILSLVNHLTEAHYL